MNIMVVVKPIKFDSIDDQLKKLNAYAQSEQHHVGHVAILGELRDSFADIESNLEDKEAVVVIDYSVISNDEGELNDFKEMLKKHKVELISLNSAIN